VPIHSGTCYVCLLLLKPIYLAGRVYVVIFQFVLFPDHTVRFPYALSYLFCSLLVRSPIDILRPLLLLGSAIFWLHSSSYIVMRALPLSAFVTFVCCHIFFSLYL
jgi:hypothetical protein